MPKTKAPDPVLQDERTIDIAGTTYDVRPLGALDIFRLVPILRSGVSVLQRAGADLERLTGADVALVVVSSLETHQQQVIDLLASLIGVKPKDFEDARRFPLDSLVDIIDAVSADPNLDAFLSKAAKLAAKYQTIPTASPESSNSSEPTADSVAGATATSS